MTLPEHPEYQRRACRGMNPNTFLYDGNPSIAQLVTAKSACDGCVIRDECLSVGREESRHARNCGLSAVYGGVLFTRNGQADVIRVAKEMGFPVVVVRVR